MVGGMRPPGTGCDHGGRRGQGREGATGGQGPAQGHAASPGMRARRGIGHGGGGAQSDGVMKSSGKEVPEVEDEDSLDISPTFSLSKTEKCIK